VVDAGTVLLERGDVASGRISLVFGESVLRMQPVEVD